MGKNFELREVENKVKRKSNKYDDLIKIFNIKDKEQYSNLSLENFLENIMLGPVKSDFTPRTVKGISNMKDEFTSLLKETGKTIFKFINNESIQEPDFDKWHNETCKNFVNEFNHFANSKNVYTISYGKAQKVVNMTFKYLFCWDANQKFGNIYPLCHIPIDSFILRWCNKLETIKTRVSTSIANIDEISWSNLDYKDYYNIQKAVKEYLESDENTILPKERIFAEFYIWPNIMVYDCVNNFKNTIYKNNQIVHSLSDKLIDELSKIQKDIETILNIK